MFDSRSLRRKLGNLLPNDARQQLQNVLTVEWDTHKTVLVEVPGAGPESARSPDMEMEGMGLNRNNSESQGYGRLDDDWDDHEDHMNPNLAIEPPRRSRSYNTHNQSQGSSSNSTSFDRPVPRPQPPRTQSQTSSEKRLPALPPNDSDNPFASADDFAPSSGFLQPARESPQTRPRGKTMEEGWNTFSNPYGQDERGLGEGGKTGWGDLEKGKEPNSPSSSRGTRDSAQTSSEENPFR